MGMMRKTFFKEVGFGLVDVVLLLGIIHTISAQPYTIFFLFLKLM
ncbi:hypothetical protein LCGC14_1143350 [marine sediment metagenome]|uniref:Uncharacterized protein n=1 Tax=marine sediment metagenome TaxID=412755 RepID=A0A0F9Q3D0_9ZZZZ